MANRYQVGLTTHRVPMKGFKQTYAIPPSWASWRHRISQFTGSSLPYAPRSRTPPGPPSPHPDLPVTALLPSDVTKPSAPGKRLFDAGHRSSHACVSTHQHVGYPKCCKTHLRPAGLSFSRAGLSPAGRLTEFQEVSPPPFHRTSIDWPQLLQSHHHGGLAGVL